MSNRNSFLSVVLLCAFCVCATQNGIAQNNTQPNKPTLAWINLGYGVAGGSDLTGVGLIANAQYDSKIGLIGLRYFMAGDTALRTGFSNYIDDLSELSITYGYSHNFGVLNLSGSAGVGTLRGEERGPGSFNSFRAVSFPIQGSVTLQPVPIIGLGVLLSASVNSRSTLAGAHFVFQLGRVR